MIFLKYDVQWDTCDESVGGDVSGDGVSSLGNYIMAARDGWAGAQLKRVSSHKD